MLMKFLFLAAFSFFSANAQAAFRVPGYELVYSYPVETTLAEPDLRLAQDVWPEMIDRARRTLDINEFYVTPSTGEPLEPTLAAMDRGPMAEDELAWMARVGAHVRTATKRQPRGGAMALLDRLASWGGPCSSAPRLPPATA